jgi:hypothetical protein
MGYIQLDETCQYPVSFTSILTRSSQPRLDLPSEFFLSGFTIKIVYACFTFSSSQWLCHYLKRRKIISAVDTTSLHLLLPRRYSPEWALASRTFFEGFVTMIVLQDGVVNPTPNPQLFWRTNVFCQGCLPELVGPNLKVSGTRFSPLHDLAVKTLPRIHDVDVHTSDLVGIDGITEFW